MNLMDGILLLFKSKPKSDTSSHPSSSHEELTPIANKASFPDPQHFLKRFMGYEMKTDAFKKIKQNQQVIKPSQSDPEITAFLDEIIEDSPKK